MSYQTILSHNYYEYIGNDDEKVISSILDPHSIRQQDFLGRTPTHLAIILKDHKTLQKLEYILENILNENRYFESIEDFKKLFKIYDHEGDTVLHKAVKYDMIKIVVLMLDFMKKYQINVIDYEVLGSGYSILHLAVRHNLLEMTRVILEKVPALRNVESYGGYLPQDEPDISLEIRVLLMNIGEVNKLKEGSMKVFNIYNN